jgi:acetolactate synthase-1/2/3 large subunit
VDDSLRQDLENGKKIIQVDDREDAFGWSARIAVGLEADTKVAVAALLDRLKEGGKPGRHPDTETVQEIKQRKPPAITALKRKRGPVIER